MTETSAPAAAATVQPDDLAPHLIDSAGGFVRALRRVVGTPWGPAAVSRAEVDVIRWLRGHPGSSINETAEGLRVAPNTVSTLVAALDRRGLVVRRPDSSDRRVSRIDLQVNARLHVEVWRDERAEIVARALTRLSPADQQALSAAADAFERLVTVLSTESAQPAGRPAQTTGQRTPEEVGR